MHGRGPALLWRGHGLARAAHAHVAAAVHYDRGGPQGATSAHPFLAVVPAAWYCALIVLCRAMSSADVWPVLQYVLKAVAVVGTLLACSGARRAGRRRFVVIVPLGIAIVSGTISTVLAEP